LHPPSGIPPRLVHDKLPQIFSLNYILSFIKD